MAIIRLKASELRDLLAPILPIAGRDDMLPVLTAVLIETRKGYVTATATDRFRAAIHRIKPEQELVEDEQTFRSLVFGGDLRRALALFKPTRYNDPQLELIESPDGHLCIADVGALTGLAGATFNMQLCEGQFPDILKLIREALATEPTAHEAGVNPSFLADFRNAAPRHTALRIRMGATSGKPIVLTGGENFVGVLMPRRLISEDNDGFGNVDQMWTAFLAPEPVAKPVAKKAPARKTTTRKAPAKKKAS